MRHLDGVYTQRFNRDLGRDGPLFRGRYHAVLIAEDAHLLVASRYIHLNPVEAGIVDAASKHPWSSYSTYLGQRRGPPWLCTQFLLELIGGREASNIYQEFVEGQRGDSARRLYDASLPVFGNETFLASVRARVIPQKEVPTSHQLVTPPSIERIVVQTAKIFDVSKSDILRPGWKHGRRHMARHAALLLCATLGGHKLVTIAAAFGLTHYTSVSMAVRRARKLRERDPDMASRLRLTREALGAIPAD